MRNRKWVGLIAVVLAILAGRAVTMAQRAELPPTVDLGPQIESKAEQKRWRTRADRQPGADEKNPLPSAAQPSTARNGPSEPLAADDPMGEVDSFLNRSRKEADESIKVLSREAETLRARLKKVDAALARWQTVAGALGQNSRPSTPESISEASPQLEPIKPPELPPELPTPPGEPPRLTPEPEPGPVPAPAPK
jgi:hypothetical protein